MLWWPIAGRKTYFSKHEQKVVRLAYGWMRPFPSDWDSPLIQKSLFQPRSIKAILQTTAMIIIEKSRRKVFPDESLTLTDLRKSTEHNQRGRYASYGIRTHAHKRGAECFLRHDLESAALTTRPKTRITVVPIKFYPASLLFIHTCSSKVPSQ